MSLAVQGNVVGFADRLRRRLSAFGWYFLLYTVGTVRAGLPVIAKFRCGEFRAAVPAAGHFDVGHKICQI